MKTALTVKSLEDRLADADHKLKTSQSAFEETNKVQDDYTIHTAAYDVNYSM